MLSKWSLALYLIDFSDNSLFITPTGTFNTCCIHGIYESKSNSF